MAEAKWFRCRHRRKIANETPTLMQSAPLLRVFAAEPFLTLGLGRESAVFADFYARLHLDVLPLVV